MRKEGREKERKIRKERRKEGRKRKDNAQHERKYLKITYLIRDLYLE